MGKGKDLELPAPPTYKTDPIFQQGYQDLYKYGTDLVKGDYSGFGGLQDATSLHPESTQLALQAAQGFLNPQYQQANLDATNAAAANDTINSSTFTDALAKNALTLQSQYQGIASGAALQDAHQARANQMSLFGTGLNTVSGATQFGFQQQGAENSFNLDNYSNLVAKVIQDNTNANKATGFQQVLGLVSPVAHDYYQSQGITSVPGYGVADVAKMASLFVPGNGGFGSGGLSSQTQVANSGRTAPSANFFASNSLGNANAQGFNQGFLDAFRN